MIKKNKVLNKKIKGGESYGTGTVESLDHAAHFAG